jgi:hypothetical protein
MMFAKGSSKPRSTKKLLHMLDFARNCRVIRARLLNHPTLFWTGALALSGAVIAGAAFFSQPEGVEQLLSIAPDAATQSLLDEVAEIYLGSGAPEDRYAAIGRLHDLGIKDERRFFDQLFYFRCRHYKSQEREIFVRAVMGLFGTPPGTVAEVVAPYIDTKDPGLWSVVVGFLAIVETNQTAPPGRRDWWVSLGYYDNALRTLDEDQRRKLIQYLFEKAPSQAVIRLGLILNNDRADYRNIVGAEHEVSESIWYKNFHRRVDENRANAAREELVKLAAHHIWWVRLYVAEIVREHEELRTPELMERLKNDEDDAVREAVVRTQSRFGPKPAPDPGPKIPPAQPGPPE